MVFDTVELEEEYENWDMVVDELIEETAEAQDVTMDELSERSIPVTAIDAATMPKVLAEPDAVSQETWDAIRAWLRTRVEDRGYDVV